MNYARILLGGLLAGVIINAGEFLLWVVLLRDSAEAALGQLGLEEAAWAPVGYVVGGFLLGFVLAWLYAAIRPRYGPGFGTAAVAGTALWLAAWIVPAIWFAVIGVAMGTGLTVLVAAWGLAEAILAAAAAGWVYREEAEHVAGHPA
jgi:hypothetical protein